MLDNKTIGKAMTIKLGNELPEYPEFDDSKRRAPDRGFRLTKAQTKNSIKKCFKIRSRRASRNTGTGVYGGAYNKRQNLCLQIQT